MSTDNSSQEPGPRFILRVIGIVALLYGFFFVVDKVVNLSLRIKLLAFIITLVIWPVFEILVLRKFPKSRRFILALLSGKLIGEDDTRRRIWIFRLGLFLTLLIVPLSWGYELVSPRITRNLEARMATATVTHTVTSTSTITQTATITSTHTPVPLGSENYYFMIVLDASVNMQASFDGQSKFDAALESIGIILAGLNPNSNYGLVVIGGSDPGGFIDPCEEPSLPVVPFVFGGVLLSPEDYQFEDVQTQIDGLQPLGRGSFYAAFKLAHNQLQDVPQQLTIEPKRTLIIITGSSDSCEKRDEWSELKKLFQIFPDVNIYTEIIILDEKAGFLTRSYTEFMNDLPEKTTVQVAQNNVELQQFSDILVQEVKSNTAPSTQPLPTNTPVGSPTYTPTLLPAAANSPTVTTAPISTVTPEFTPTTASAPQPSVDLLSYSYVGTGINCQANISVRVSGSPATGSFHVWNASYPPEGDVYASTTIPVGTSNYLVTLGGNSPEYYYHDVWFVYDGSSTNRLSNLICPGLP